MDNGSTFNPNLVEMQNTDTPRKLSGHSKQVRCGLVRHLLVMLYDTLIVIALMMFGTSLLMIFQSGSFTAGKDVLFHFIYSLSGSFIWIGAGGTVV